MEGSNTNYISVFRRRGDEVSKLGVRVMDHRKTGIVFSGMDCCFTFILKWCQADRTVNGKHCRSRGEVNVVYCFYRNWGLCAGTDLEMWAELKWFCLHTAPSSIFRPMRGKPRQERATDRTSVVLLIVFSPCTLCGGRRSPTHQNSSILQRF